MSKTIGIDLGTTNSAIAFLEGNQPVIIPNAEGGRTTPSVVAFSKNGERLVGQLAKRQAAINPLNTIYSIKRFMGRTMGEINSELKQVPYSVAAGKNNRAEVSIEGKKYTPEAISAVILQKLKADAEAFLGEKVTDAIITVPAYFGDAQRQATKNAGEIAGLNVLRIINEPTSAALAYGLDKGKNEKVLIFDLGGGTFDVSILDISDGVFEVLATNGDTHLGGDDYDRKIVDWIADEFKKSNGIDLKKDVQALSRLTEAAEKAKIELSQMMETNINLPFITADQTGPRHLDMKLSRSFFEQLTNDLTTRCEAPLQNALRDAKLSAADIDEVIMVGGSTRMPVIQNLVKKLTHKEPNLTVNPDEVVAIGAAIQGGVLSGSVKDVLLLDVIPLSLGIMTEGAVNTILIERNTTIPTHKSEVFSTAVDNQDSVEIVVLQGERPLARDNRILGKFTLSGILPALRGIPQLEVSFDIDASGILNVTAKDNSTGKVQKVTISGASTMEKAEVERLIKEADLNRSADEKAKEDIALKNKAEGVIYAVQSAVKQYGDKIPLDLTQNIQNGINELQHLIDDKQYSLLANTTAQLEQTLQSIGQYIYSSNQSDQSEQPTPLQEEDVVDAQYKEI